MHTVTAHGGGELIATLQSIPRLRSRLSALPPPLRSAALPTRLSALPSLPCMSVRLFFGAHAGAPHAAARTRAEALPTGDTQPLAAPVRRARWVRAAPTIGATRGASAVAMAVETCLLACLLAYLLACLLLFLYRLDLT